MSLSPVKLNISLNELFICVCGVVCGCCVCVVCRMASSRVKAQALLLAFVVLFGGYFLGLYFVHYLKAALQDPECHTRSNGTVT